MNPHDSYPEPHESIAVPLSQRPWLTWLLIGANVLVFLAMAASTGNFASFTVADLLAWGGNFAPAVAEGELWRPVTAMFLHGGIMHIALNMWVLSMIGPFMERLYGKVGFLLLYFLAGLAGSVLGMPWHPLSVGVGASGAIFGLFGGLLGFLLARRSVIPTEVMRPLLQNGLYFVGINIVLGFAVPGIDVAAHIFGAVAGFVGAYLGACLQLESPKASWLWRNGVLLLLLLGVLAALPLCIPSSARAQARLIQATEIAQQEEGALNDTFLRLVRQHRAGELDDPIVADRIEQEVLKPWSAMKNRFPPLEELPTGSSPKVSGLYRYLELREEGLQSYATAARTQNDALYQQAEARFREANGAVADIRQDPPES